MRRLIAVAGAAASLLAAQPLQAQTNPDSELHQVIQDAQGGSQPSLSERNDAEVSWEWAERGIILSAETVDKMQWLDRMREDLLTRKNELERDARKLREAGWDEQADGLDQMRDQLNRIWREVPQYETSEGWLTNFRRYIERRDAKTLYAHAQKLKEIDAQLDELADQLGEERLKLSRQRQEGEKRQQVEQVAGSSTAGRAGAAGASAAGAGAAAAERPAPGYEATVVSVVGDARFFINGEPVSGSGGFFRSNGDGAFQVRVMALPETRKRSLAFRPTANTVSFINTPHKWEYTISSGNFTGTTTWMVSQETYDWQILARDEKAIRELRQNSGIDPAVKNDVLLIKPLAGTEATLTASGDLVWKRESSRKTFLSDITEAAGGSITLRFLPVVR